MAPHKSLNKRNVFNAGKRCNPPVQKRFVAITFLRATGFVFPHLLHRFFKALALFLITLITLSGCTSVVVDHYSNGILDLHEGDAVVVLGRRTASNYDTEEDLISCVGDSLGSDNSTIIVIPEHEFVDSLYPWFEPRTAPVQVEALGRLVKQDKIAKVMKDYNIQHIIWIDGKTETTSSSGSIGCSIGIGGAGCFGFGSWDQESRYEATIWDYETQKMVAKISADASGTSYMPAVIVPIPLIARVQSGACRGLADQLNSFFTPPEARRN